MFREKKYTPAQKLATSGLLVAITVIINFISREEFVFGNASKLRLTFGSPFTFFAGIVFGPLYGGMAGAASDILCYVLNPRGAYIPWLTLNEFLTVALISLIWCGLKKIDFKIYRSVYILFFSVIFEFGILNLFFMKFFPHLNSSEFFSETLDRYSESAERIITNTDYLIIGFIVAGAIGLVSYIAAKTFMKKKARTDGTPYFEYYLKLFIAVTVPMIIFTTVNTPILRAYGEMPAAPPFLYAWLPRFIAALIKAIYSIYIIIFITDYFERVVRKKTA